jgi:hypothetical protein
MNDWKIEVQVEYTPHSLYHVTFIPLLRKSIKNQVGEKSSNFQETGFHRHDKLPELSFSQL